MKQWDSKDVRPNGRGGWDISDDAAAEIAAMSFGDEPPEEKHVTVKLLSWEDWCARTGIDPSTPHGGGGGGTTSSSR